MPAKGVGGCCADVLSVATSAWQSCGATLRGILEVTPCFVITEVLGASATC